MDVQVHMQTARSTENINTSCCPTCKFLEFIYLVIVLTYWLVLRCFLEKISVRFYYIRSDHIARNIIIYMLLHILNFDAKLCTIKSAFLCFI